MPKSTLLCLTVFPLVLQFTEIFACPAVCSKNVTFLHLMLERIDWHFLRLNGKGFHSTCYPSSSIVYTFNWQFHPYCFCNPTCDVNPLNTELKKKKKGVNQQITRYVITKNSTLTRFRGELEHSATRPCGVETTRRMPLGDTTRCYFILVIHNALRL